MYYERTETGWKQNHSKSIFFENNTHPIESVPVEFWNADRMPAAPVPVYDVATHKLVGPQEIGDETVGYVAVELTAEEIEANYQMTVPTFVTMRKARVWLVRNNLLDTVNARVHALGQEAIETWNTSHECQRINPILNAVLDGIGYTELGKDQMFIEADKL